MLDGGLATARAAFALALATAWTALVLALAPIDDSHRAALLARRPTGIREPPRTERLTTERDTAPASPSDGLPTYGALAIC
ncbi:hypothetical protein TPA0598_08_04800 [Streptomyces lydicamycinicus]|uniref:Uncharacterized protein n=1 Tax=Streptomyces lydicamycinicus TaxID=1546107 RepID=A0A0P4RE86_9ACTN|nr:hypothetical protein TPA0598_08_04800 [Streptomyces lydicamycinicus]